MNNHHGPGLASRLAVLGALTLSLVPAASAAAAAGKPVLAARVSAGRLVAADGTALVLRGVNVSGLEDYAIQGWAWDSDHKH